MVQKYIYFVYTFNTAGILQELNFRNIISERMGTFFSLILIVSLHIFDCKKINIKVKQNVNHYLIKDRINSTLIIVSNTAPFI